MAQYARKDGLTYRLVPVKNNTGINVDWVVDKLENKFAFGSANIKGVYFDEQNRLHLSSIRSVYADAAAAEADLGKKDIAKKLLDMSDKGITEADMPYAMVSHYNQHNYATFRFLEACYKSGYKELADHVSKALHKDFDQQMKYYQHLSESKQEGMKTEMQGTQQLQQMLGMMEAQYSKGTSGSANPELQNIISNAPDSGAKTPDSKK